VPSHHRGPAGYPAAYTIARGVGGGGALPGRAIAHSSRTKRRLAPTTPCRQTHRVIQANVGRGVACQRGALSPRTSVVATRPVSPRPSADLRLFRSGGGGLGVARRSHLRVPNSPASRPWAIKFSDCTMWRTDANQLRLGLSRPSVYAEADFSGLKGRHRRAATPWLLLEWCEWRAGLAGPTPLPTDNMWAAPRPILVPVSRRLAQFPRPGVGLASPPSI